MVFSGDCSTVRQPRIVEVSSGEGDAYLPSLQPRSFHPQCKDPIFSEHVIFEKLNNLKVTKSPGLVNIHPRILYELRYELIHPLKILFDTSYKLNQLPSDWKNGHITAIFKKGSKCDPSNYRPISLTSVVFKIMESIIRDHIMDYFFITTTSVSISMVLLRVDLPYYN